MPLHGTWTACGGGGGGKGVVVLGAAALGVFLAAEAAKGAARTLGEVLVLAAVAVLCLAIGAAAAFVVIRCRVARAMAPQPQQRALPAHLYRTNPHALPSPVREPRAIAAPAQPEIHVHFGADLADLLRHQAPAVRVIPPASEEDHDA